MSLRVGSINASIMRDPSIATPALGETSGKTGLAATSSSLVSAASQETSPLTSTPTPAKKSPAETAVNTGVVSTLSSVTLAASSDATTSAATPTPAKKSGPARLFTPVAFGDKEATEAYVFACTNHSGQKETQRVFAQEPLRGNAIYGCGIFSVFNFASLKEGITHVGAFDINPRVGLFSQDIVDILSEEGLTLARARKEIFTYLQRDTSGTQALAREISSGLSFLSTKERFERTQQFLSKFSFTQMNFYNFTEVGAFLERQRSQGAVFHMFYISNIPEFTCSESYYQQFAQKEAEREDSYASYTGLEKSLSLLPSAAIIIDAKKKESADLYRTQRIHLSPEKTLMPPPCFCAFEQALMTDNYDIVTSCLKNGATLSAIEESGFTGLMLTAEKSKHHAMRALLDFKADPNASDQEGYHALHFAAQKNNYHGMELLLTAKANVGPKTTQLLTPLHMAACKGNLVAAAMLIQSGGDKQARDILGYTPFQLTRLKEFPAYGLSKSHLSLYQSLQRMLLPDVVAALSNGSASSSSSSSSLPSSFLRIAITDRKTEKDTDKEK